MVTLRYKFQSLSGQTFTTLVMTASQEHGWGITGVSMLGSPDGILTLQCNNSCSDVIDRWLRDHRQFGSCLTKIN